MNTTIHQATQAKKTESKICLKCGKEFNRRRFGKRLEDFTRWNDRKYCSKSCNYIRKPISDRSSFHRLARNYVSQCCNICGSTENLDVHHKDRFYKNNETSNLETLCHSCHMKLHWRQGDLKPQFQNLKRGTQMNQSKPTETP